MVYRFSWIAGLAGIALALWESTFVLRDSSSGTSWQIVIVVSVLLSMGITWTALAYKARVWIAVAANAIAFILVAGFLIAPETLWGIFPTGETFQAFDVELRRALEIIQHGVEPVRPVPGLVMLLAGLFWTLGFLLVAGLLNNRPFVATLTPLIIALQFVIIDRQPKGIAHLAVFIGVAAFTLLAVRIDERDQGTGRLARTNAVTSPSKRPSPGVAILVGVTVGAALLAVGFAGDVVPQDGVVSWRSPAGYIDGYSGSGTYNPYTDIRANLIEQSDNPLFTATIVGDVDPTSVRFRLLTLDAFDGTRWRTDRIQAFPLDEEPWTSESQIYRGPTTSIAAQVRIENLSMNWLPTPVTATAATTLDESDYLALRTRRLDGSIYFPGDFTREGMEYAVTADIPTFSAADYADLARTDDGTLSPLFATAETDGRIVQTPNIQLPEIPLENVEFWTEYPEDLGAQVVGEARDITRNMDTNFEKALALESFFRQDGGFVYNTSVPSDFTTDNVSDWLFDEDNEFTRNGYCEQFATTMALMARAVGVPSRVVLGFTGGQLVNDDTVLIRDKNAHSWVEIWIPSHGWMAFDPTPRSTNATPTIDSQIEETLGFSAAAYVPEIPSGNLVDTATDGAEAFDNPSLVERVERDPAFAATGAGGSEDAGSSLPDWAGPALIALLVIALLATLAPITKWVRRKRRARRLAQGDISAAWDDITDRLTDLGEPFDPAATPVEAAAGFDDAFLPLARTYGDALYGEKTSSAAVIDRATVAHERAEQHLTTRYSRTQRVIAAYRPTRLLNRLKRFSFRSNK